MMLQRFLDILSNIVTNYGRVASTSPSGLEALAGFFQIVYERGNLMFINCDLLGKF